MSKLTLPVVITIIGFSLAVAAPTWSQPPVPPVTDQQRRSEPASDPTTRHPTAIDEHADEYSPALGLTVGSCPGNAVCITAAEVSGPAQIAGIRQGDYILMVDGEKTTKPTELASAIANRKPGEKVTVILWRSGHELTTEVMLAPTAENAQKQKAWLGVSLSAEPSGRILVEQVVPNGPADRAGIRDGDLIVRLNDTNITDPEALAHRLGDLQPGTEIQLAIRRGGVSLIINAKLGKMTDALQAMLRPETQPTQLKEPGGTKQSTPVEQNVVEELRRQIHELQEKIRALTGKDGTSE